MLRMPINRPSTSSEPSQPNRLNIAGVAFVSDIVGILLKGYDGYLNTIIVSQKQNQAENEGSYKFVFAVPDRLFYVRFQRCEPDARNLLIPGAVGMVAVVVDRGRAG